MSFKQFNRIQTQDRIISQIQDNIEKTFNPIVFNVALDSIILPNVFLQSGITNNISHKLGRRLSGWKVIRNRASCIIYDNQDENPNPNLTLWLLTDADTTVNLEVF